MKKILKNYKSTLILLLAIIIGAIVGIIFKEDAKVLSPLGDIFINLLLVVIVPLVFLTITTSIAKMSTPKRLGKIMITTIVAFLVTSIVAVIVGFITTYNIDLVKPEDTAKITSTLVNEEMKNEDLPDILLHLGTFQDFPEDFHTARNIPGQAYDFHGVDIISEYWPAGLKKLVRDYIGACLKKQYPKSGKLKNILCKSKMNAA